MKRLAVLFPALAWAVALAAAPSAPAQQPTPRTTTRTLSMYSLAYLADPALQKELKLSDEQVKKLDAERSKLGTTLFTARSETQRDETTKAVDKAIADLLEPAQVKRLKQIVLQQLDRTVPSTRTSSVLARMPEVAKELKLTDEQIAKTGTKLTELLSDEQKKIWKEMSGEKFETALKPATAWGSARDTTQGGGFETRRPTLPNSIHYLTQKGVVEELKLAEDQVKKIAEIQEKWQKEMPATVRTPEDSQKRAEVTAAADKEAAEVLYTVQARRLSQILLQRSLTNGREAAVFTHPDAVKELKLSDAQTAKIKTIQEERRKTMAPLFLTGDSSEEIATRVTAHKKATYEQLVGVLNAGQQLQLKELIGEPFKGEILAHRGSDAPGVSQGGGPGSGFTPTTPIYLTVVGLTYVENKPLQEELNLTEDQVKKLVELSTKSRARSSEIREILRQGGSTEVQARLLAEQARDNEKTLGEILKPEQMTRFKQVMLQYYATTSGRVPPNSLGRISEVVEGLQLTKEQKADVLQGKALAQVLNEKQQKQWKDMLGKPFEKVADLRDQSTGGRGGPRRPTTSTPTHLSTIGLQFAGNKPLHEELQLSDDQVKRLIELGDKSRARTTEITRRGGSGEEAEKQRAQQAKDNDKALAEILKPKQLSRYNQVILQAWIATLPRFSQGTQGYLGRVVEVAEGLKLTTEQKEELQQGKEIAKVLDEKQQKQWKEMLGEPFAKASEMRPAFGGSGGFGNNPPTSTPLLYLSISGVTYVNNKALQEELKLTEDQVKRLLELRDKSATRTREIGPVLGRSEEQEKLRAQQAKDNEKALAEILKPEQVTRFKQLILQGYAASSGSGFTPSRTALPRLVEVSEGLKLTNEQKAELQRGDKEIAQVLDEKQEKLWKAMIGEPFAKAAELLASQGSGGFGRPPGSRTRGETNSLLRYLEGFSVQEELKLTEGQLKKLPELKQKWSDLTRDLGSSRGGPGGGTGPSDYAKQLAEANAAMEKAIASVLDEKQMTRLHQIELQQTQKVGIGRLLADARVQKGVGLSEEQLKKIADISTDSAKTQELIGRELRVRFEEGGAANYNKTSDEFARITNKKLAAVLTGKQHDKLKALLGEPFKGALGAPYNMLEYVRTTGKEATMRFTVTGDGLAGQIWGSDIYTADSAIAAAVVHAGLLKDGETGTVTIVVLAGQSSYPGETRNGVRSTVWPSNYFGSYKFEGKAEIRQPMPK